MDEAKYPRWFFEWGVDKAPSSFEVYLYLHCSDDGVCIADRIYFESTFQRLCMMVFESVQKFLLFALAFASEICRRESGGVVDIQRSTSAVNRI